MGTTLTSTSLAAPACTKDSKIDLYESRTKSIDIASNHTFLHKSRELTKKNVEDLRKDATEQGLNNIDDEGKLLKKQELVESLLNQFMTQV